MGLGSISLPPKNALKSRIVWATVGRGGSSSPNADARSIRRNLGPPHSRELKICLRDITGALELDWILGVAGDFADKGFQLFRIFCV